MFLLDTNVVSELRKAPFGRADLNVVAWAEPIPPTSLFLSVVTILEIETGLLRLERRDAQQGHRLRTWLESDVLRAFEGRIVPFDVPIARQCAALHVPNPRPERDAIIAATALVRGLTVTTRSTRDFADAGVRVLNPWELPA
jgi:toxin FitB